MRKVRLLIAVLCLLCLLASSCTWGVHYDELEYSGAREAWEVPVGVIYLPVAFSCDLVCTVVINIFNPFFWLGAAIEEADEDYENPFVIQFFLQSAIATTMINPYCNVDTNRKIPPGAIGFSGDDDDDYDDHHRYNHGGGESLDGR